ncbi:MAG: hypothetical protein Q9191_002815 [Dirinaria sp. TL-2023a]
MIGTSTPEYVFIRASIFCLHYLIPFGAFAYVIISIIQPSNRPIPLIFEIWAILEVLFFTLVFLPRRYVLQRPAIHPADAPRQKRRKLFDKCHATIEQPEQYLSKWFKNAPLSEIKRDNLKDFYCWAFLNKFAYGLLDDEELEEYVGKFEKLLGRKLEPGRGVAKPLRLTIDEVKMMHRPLVWYLIVSIVDSITHIYMLFHSFRFYRLPLKHFFTVFPFRPLTLFSLHRSPATTLTYWYRPHTSKQRLPVLFIHGIGIGLYTYTNFLADLNHPNIRPSDQDPSEPLPQDANDGDIGIIALEIMPISFRITRAMPDKETLVNEIHQILHHHSWNRFILAAHSYGSVISTYLLQSALTAAKTGPLVLVDPVSILLHRPDVAYNFTARRPRMANEHQLYYFAAMDMCVAHTLYRHFFWNECVLWKEDVRGRDVTVSCSGRDLIVDTRAVAKYLVEDENENQSRKWKGQGIDLMWFEDLDHAQVFDRRRDYAVLVQAVRRYSMRR